MILYCMQHTANILRCIVHKFKFHPDDEAVFLVEREVSSPYCPHIDKIKYYQTPDLWDIACHDSESTEEEKRYTEEKISEFLREENLDLQQFTHIYAAFDLFNPFILYFEMHSIKHMLVEFVTNFFDLYESLPRETFMGLRLKETKAFDTLILDMHLHDGFSANCTKVFLCSAESKYEAKPGRAPAEVLGFYETLVALEPEHKRMIIEGYNIAKFDFDAVILFNSPLFSRGYSKTCNLVYPPKFIENDKYGGVYYLYKAIIDYYFSDIDLAVKIHPESEENFVKAFSDFKLLPKEAPMEIFLLLDKKFDIICPLKSTGIEIYQEHNFNITSFGLPFMSFFKSIHFLFLTFTLVSAIGVPEIIHISGIEPDQLVHFIKWVYKDFADVKFEVLNKDNVKNAELIIAEPDKEFSGVIKDAPESCLIFANGNCRADRRIFTKREMIYSLIDLSDEQQEEVQQFDWTILSKSPELADSVSEFSASYVLERAKVMIQSSPST